jgi:hypothetical protein
VYQCVILISEKEIKVHNQRDLVKNKLKKIDKITPELLTELDEKNKFVCHSCLSINDMANLICQDEECSESATKNVKTVRDYHD